MKMIREISAMVLALALLPALAFAAELKGTVVKVDKAKNQLVVKTDKGEQTLLLGSSTKGVDNAKEGKKVTIQFTEKDGQPRVTEIAPQEDGTTQKAPR
ncbi:MAG: hypothetical protein A2038_06845 [Deltaproteobacteria bacterium GWA2_57_13]|nr:MAG: hypothetical protein A2038_06845 [Deltaproteobacteria bacterium GWA2_57_13]